MTPKTAQRIDVLCVGHASYDLVFTVERHPGPDEKLVASDLISSGGGPASNASVAVTRMGGSSAFAGYIGSDTTGQNHFEELRVNSVETNLVVRGKESTPLSVVIVKPNGARALINYPGGHVPLAPDSVNFKVYHPSVVLLDGHELNVSLDAIEHARQMGAVTVLDAGSLRKGTRALATHVDYLVASERFALDFSGKLNVFHALRSLSSVAPTVVITRGENGLVWCSSDCQEGHVPAFPIKVVDTTGAGDVFHGAFSLGLANGMEWNHLLRYASAAAAISCTRKGTRTSIPTQDEVLRFLNLP